MKRRLSHSAKRKSTSGLPQCLEQDACARFLDARRPRWGVGNGFAQAGKIVGGERSPSGKVIRVHDIRRVGRVLKAKQVANLVDSDCEELKLLVIPRKGLASLLATGREHPPFGLVKSDSRA